MGRKENSCCNEYHTGEHVNMAIRGALAGEKIFLRILNAVRNKRGRAGIVGLLFITM